MKYMYLKNIKCDVLAYLQENYDYQKLVNQMNIMHEDYNENLECELSDEMFNEDSVTGNASGSYTFNTWTAEDLLCHNLDILADALEEFGFENIAIIRDAETCDVIIRSYLLNFAIYEVLSEIKEGTIGGWE